MNNQTSDVCPYRVVDTTKLEVIFVIAVTILVFLYSFLYSVTFLRRSKVLWAGKGICREKKCRILLAIAHPDDEVMFFGPTILNLLHSGHSVYILCFSYGDCQGLGWVRKEELWKSCRILGVPDENVMIVKNDKFRDNPDWKWPILPLSLHIKGFIVSYGIDTLITFDHIGVTGHLNHISVYNAALDLIERNLLPADCEVFSLTSVGVLRQYVPNVFNIPVSYYYNLYVLVAKGGDYRRILRAMKAHASQMLWYRHLHVFFSMYLFVNVLKRISKPVIF